ncbi:MAG: YidC/Oxa1 family membrane protein insertase [Eggerthellaceae bacterium]|jgi:YidC/Oxa1 family membrane protein insertase|nr:YidC/Oxa1 family membrane protein insertase [Eggerthellaceae bacterium]
MWEAFKDWIFWVIDGFHSVCGDWGLAIILVTVIFRVLITPLIHKQTKSTYQMQKVQPLLQEIQEKYKDDPIRKQEEMQKLQANANFNPLGGCLPMLLQMPIFIALFQVLREMETRVQGMGYSFYNFVPDLVMTPAQAFASGYGTFVPFLILMLVFAGSTFVPMFLQQRGKNSPQQKQTLMMGGGMSIFMLFISWNFPAGVLLFWGASGLIGILQQQVSLGIMRSRDVEDEAVIELKPVEVDVTRKVKKPRPTKKTK